VPDGRLEPERTSPGIVTPGTVDDQSTMDPYRAVPHPRSASKSLKASQAVDAKSVLTRVQNGHKMSIIIRDLWIFNKVRCATLPRDTQASGASCRACSPLPRGPHARPARERRHGTERPAGR
jgi:hypothetical protein